MVFLFKGTASRLAYWWYAGKIAGTECSGFVFGPYIHVSFQAEEHVVGFFVVVEADWVIG